MGGRNPPESVDGLQRNQWTICAGIGGRFAAESVVDLRRNTQPALALALFELLQDLSHALWDQYETDLIELIMAEPDQVPPAQQTLDFNDELPF